MFEIRNVTKRFDGVPFIPEEALQERIAFWTQQA